MNLESLLRITAKVSGLDSLRKLSKGIGEAEKSARKAEKRFKQMLDSRLFRTAAVAATAFGAAIALSTKAAIDFESSMADVRKVVDGLESPKAFQEISDEIIDLSRQMPIAAKGFAEIYAAAGQAGIAREDLKEFATQVAQVAVAFDMTAEQAGTAMAKLQTSLGLSISEVGDLTDAMNHLSNNSASSASQIVDFTLRAGQAGKSAGLTAEETAAFGAAMISAGAEADVAGTSFRNMIKALSRGPSMTDRQISALTRLGYAQDDAVVNEERYTQEARTQSEQRIEAARHETNELSKELNRRFRDQMRSIQDNFDDESEAFEEQVQDRVDAQIKGLQRQQENEIEAARQRAEASGRSAKNEINAIRDRYDERIDVIRDQAQDELKQQRRFNRDRLQQISDDMNDRKDAELAGLQSNFEESQAKETQLMEARLAEIKAKAKAGATAAAKALAKGLQEDAIGTITDVFNRIRELPKEAQLSVISDLFGDEARGILPLINNTALLEKSMRLVGDKSKYAGSTLKEFLTRSATTANQIKLAQNNLDALAITFGTEFAPALSTVLQAFAPVLEGFAWLLQNVPGLAPTLAVLTTAFVGLVAVLPAISSLLTIFPGIASAIGGVVTALTGGGGIMAAIAAVFSGPVGWIALVVAAGVAIYAFRDQIGAAFAKIGEFIQAAWNLYKSIWIDPVINAGKMIYDFFAENWDAIYEVVSGVVTKAFEIYRSVFIDPVLTAGKAVYDFFAGTFQKLGEMIAAPFKAAFNVVRGVVNSILQGVANAINGVVNAINGVIRGANQATSKVGLPQIPQIPQVQVPQFAEGGMVTGPTLAMVGEGGQPEYIVPASKAGAFAANIMAGVRGPGAIPRFAEGGYVAPSANVSIQTGPVTQMNGTNFVTTSDLTKAVQAGVNQTLDLIRRDGNTRAALGLS